MRKTKEGKGITLIALIITIVVLIILAVVGISGIENDGILQHANNAAALDSQRQEEKEEVLTELDGILDEYKKCEHNYVEKTSLSVAATCTTNGEKVLRCSKCRREKKEVITATGHNYEVVTSIEGTCETPGSQTLVCSKCENFITKATALAKHTWAESGRRILYCL